MFSSSKCAVNGYSDVLRREMKKFGVKVFVLEPSFYKTPLMDVKPLNDQVDKMYEACPIDEKQFYDSSFVDFCEFL